jgi:hypothetical protein
VAAAVGLTQATVATQPPEAATLANAFGLGVGRSPVERIEKNGWRGHNVLWRLTTSEGLWAIKEVGREPGANRAGALAVERAAYAAGRIELCHVCRLSPGRK